MKYIGKISDPKDLVTKEWVESNSGGGALVFTDVAVATSDYTADALSEVFGYKATITLSGVTYNHYPEVTFGIDDSINGIFAPVCSTDNGHVYIYATTPTAVTIPTIIATKVG